MHLSRLPFLLVVLIFFACNSAERLIPIETSAATPHSFALFQEARAKHLNLNLKVDFDQKKLSGTATWEIEQHGAEKIIFDTKGLAVDHVAISSDGDQFSKANFSLGAIDEVLGQPMAVAIEPGTKWVSIYYATTDKSEALLWLEKEQTQGKQLPFLFTHAQPILTRSWIPSQDSPGNRVTYNATIQVPPGHLALMSAKNPVDKRADGIYNFQMELPISTYLIALAVGDLVFERISDRVGVYAEPAIAIDAAIEFDRTEGMMQVAEEMFGPYGWGRYDILVLPPSFPYGGMENPRLTFVTPTIIVGDRSLTVLIAHELAHSWSGNLVTNATWDDFWLNEGITSYIERRIVEKTFGEDYRHMLALLGYQDVQRDIKKLGAESKDTHLKQNLRARNPDEGSTNIPYEKGAHFMDLLEQVAGQEKFDAFLNKYFSTFQFRAVTTEEFVQFLKRNLLEPNKLEVNIEEWVYGPGLPDNCPIAVSERFNRVDTVLSKIGPWSRPTRQTLKGLSAFEWLHFIRHMPRDFDNRTMKSLDLNFKFSDSRNSEIQAAWFEVAILNGYSQNLLPKIEAFLIRIGRRKFLSPIYKAFITRGQAPIAKGIYDKARPGYHAVTQSRLDGLFVELK